MGIKRFEVSHGRQCLGPPGGHGTRSGRHAQFVGDHLHGLGQVE